MKLKINQREKNLILIFLGVIVLAMSYYFGYSAFKTETERLKLENRTLEKQIQALEKMEQYRESYVSETGNMQKNMKELIQKFPADIIAEDIILYVRELENKNDVYVNHITVPAKEYVEFTTEYENDILNSMSDVTGVIAEYGFVNKGTIPQTQDMYLTKVKSDIVYSVTYDGLKDVIREIIEDENRKSVDNISLVFNENTGNLAGNMTINYFALSGTGKNYQRPSVKGNLHGIDCIFGDLSTGLSTDLNTDLSAE